MSEPAQTIADRYSERVRRYSEIAEGLGARSRLVSNLRGLAFGGFTFLGLYAVFGSDGKATGPIAAFCGVAFVSLVVWHARVIRREEEARRWAWVNRDAFARNTNAWRTLQHDGARFMSADHDYSGDLDLFGPGSVFQRVNSAQTHYGQAALAGYLKAPASVAKIAQRQEAVQGLAPELEVRQQLEALAWSIKELPPRISMAASERRRDAAPPDPEPLLRWAESDPVLGRPIGLVVAAFALPPVTLVAMGVTYFTNLPSATWLAPLILQVVVSLSARARTSRVFHAVSETQGAFTRYAPMLELLDGLSVDARLIEELRRGARASRVPPPVAMRQFERILGWFELRHNGLAHPFIDALLLWDIHCVLRLEAWQRRTGADVRGWFEALGELEALSSFAGLAHDHPDFAWPEIDESAVVFEAEALAHPLIDDNQRVANDVALSKDTRAFLITGSNMSGKSTFLRALGVASVMALAGAPVCARRLRLSPFRVRTSIRISDSLELGVSHFYAEVRKLGRVVASTEEAGPVLFLLDEILHGTNSQERQVGARWTIATLIERGAMGVVSTHDMGLCELPEPLMRVVEQWHFREGVEGDQMTFDYTLRSGPVSGGNALRLMRLVGLDVPLIEPDTPM